jgi:predicted dithiol-disulfide oxidoreductase (DUF899 family)
MTDAPSRTHADVGLPEVVSPAEWRASFEALLTREKALTAARDEMSAARRRMPMMRVDTGHRFAGSAGEVGLVDLFFEGRRQLIVYRFFYVLWLLHVRRQHHAPRAPERSRHDTPLRVRRTSGTH